MLPSWTRSSSGIWDRPYLRATETTSRRLAVMNRCIARSPSRPGTPLVLGRSLGCLPRSPRDVTGQDLFRIEPGLDRLGQLDLFFGGEQRCLGDAF